MFDVMNEQSSAKRANNLDAPAPAESIFFDDSYLTTEEPNAKVAAKHAHSSDARECKTSSPSLLDWVYRSGETLAQQLAEKTPNGGLMILGPSDTMRDEAKKCSDPDKYFPVFTHSDEDDFHIYYGLHQGRKEYSAETMVALIKEHVAPHQPIRLLGCESGSAAENGIAKQLAKLLPDNPVYAPNGYCELSNGKATVFLKKPSEVKPVLNPNEFGFAYPEIPKGKFVLVKPE